MRTMRRFLPLLTAAFLVCSPDVRTYECDRQTPCPFAQQCLAGVCQPSAGGDPDAVDADRDSLGDLSGDAIAPDGPTDTGRESAGDGATDVEASTDADAGADAPADADAQADPDVPSDLDEAVDPVDGDAADAPEADAAELDGCWPEDPPGDAPTVIFEIPLSLDDGTRQYHAQLSFSEPVWGVDRKSLTIDNGATIWHITTADRESWGFDIIGLWATGEFTVELSDAVRNAAGVPLSGAPQSWSFEVGGEVIYVREGFSGSGENPRDPTCCIQDAIGDASRFDAPAAVLVAEGDYVEQITLLGSVGVFGGFSAGFDERDSGTHQATIHSPGGTTVTVNGAVTDPDATLDGFTLINADTASGPATVALSEGARATISHNSIQRTGTQDQAYAVTNAASGGLLIENDVWIKGSNAVVAVANVDRDPDWNEPTRIYYNTIGTELDSLSGTAKGIRILESDTLTEIVGNRILGGLAAGDNELVGIELFAEGYIVNNLISAGVALGDAAVCHGLEVDDGGSGLVVHNVIDGGTCGGQTVAVYLGEAPDVSLANNILFTAGGGSTLDAGVFEPELTSDPLAVRNNLVFDVDSLYADERGTAHYTDIDEVNSSMSLVVDRDCDGVCETAQVGGNATVSATPEVFFADFTGADLLVYTLEDNDWRGAVPDVAEQGLDTATDACGTSESPVDCGSVIDDADGGLRTVPVSIGAYEQELACP